MVLDLDQDDFEVARDTIMIILLDDILRISSICSVVLFEHLIGNNY